MRQLKADDNPSLSPKVMVQAKGGLYRGAGLLARWLRNFTRGGRLAALGKAACIVERGSWPAVRASLSGMDVSLRS